MWFSCTNLASVLDGGTFALTFHHKGSSSGQLFNSGETHEATLLDQQRRETIKNTKTEKEMKNLVSVLDSVTLASACYHKGSSSGLLYNSGSRETHEATLPNQQRKETNKNTIKKTEKDIKKVNDKQEQVLYVTIKPRHVGDALTPFAPEHNTQINTNVGKSKPLGIMKLLPKVLIGVAILVSPPSLSFDAHSAGSFIGASVVSAASIDNFEEHGIGDVRELEQSEQGMVFTIADDTQQNEEDNGLWGSTLNNVNGLFDAVDAKASVITDDTKQNEDVNGLLRSTLNQSNVRGVKVGTEFLEAPIVVQDNSKKASNHEMFLAQTKEASKLRGSNNGNNHKTISNVVDDTSHTMPTKTDKVNEQVEMKKVAKISLGVDRFVPIYQGCWTDSNPRALPHRMAPDKGNSLEQCQDKCLQNGYTYAGRQWYGECWCGGEDENYKRYGSAEGCKCHGSNVGARKNCVYQIKASSVLPLPEWTPNPSSSICGLPSSDIDKYINPPKEVMDLVKIGLGIEWGTNTIRSFSSEPASATDQDVCGDLANIMASEKPFVVVSAQDPIEGELKVLLDEDAQDQSCNREKRTNKKNSCPKTVTAIDAEEIENPVSTVLSMVLPICMGIRFCDDSDEIMKRVQFGFVTHANDGSGIRIATLYGVDIYFQALAFDTKGKLNFAFDAKLINPKGGLLDKPKGAHFLLRGGMGFPLTKKVKGGSKKSLGEVSVTGQFGMYGEVTVDGDTTADVMKIINYLGDLEQLASKFNNVFFQIFFSLKAVISIDLGVLFNTNFKIQLDLSVSSMLEVQVGTGESDTTHTDELPVDLGCWTDSIPRALPHRMAPDKGNSLEQCQDKCLQNGYTYAGRQWYGECWCGGEDENYKRYGSAEGCKCHGSNVGASKNCVYQIKGKPPGYRQALSAKSHEIVVGSTLETDTHLMKSAAECYNEATAANQGSYIAFYLSEERKLSKVLSDVLEPFGKFGEFLGSLIPFKDVTVALRTYLKLPLSGLAHFILQFAVEITINCGIIDFIKGAVEEIEDLFNEDIWTKLPGSAALDAFCSETEPKISATISIGFEGMNLDRKNSFLEFGANEHKTKIGFDIFPSCPAPVLPGGDCSGNDDCISAAHDPEASSCAEFAGYCKNHDQLKTSIGCSGKCIEKLEHGAVCSKSALNIHWADTSKGGESGDDNACKSGQCICGRCADPGTVPNGRSCSENDDCSSGYCMGWSTIACLGTCHPKAKEGESCSPNAAKDFFSGLPTSAADEYCETGHCICDYCANTHGKVKEGQTCGTHDNCDGSMICDEDWQDAIGCKGQCKDQTWFKIILNRDKSVVQPDTCEAGSDLRLRPNSNSDLQLWKKVKGGFVSKCQNNEGKTLAITSETQPPYCRDDTLQLWTVHSGVITENQKWFLKGNGDQLAQTRCPNKCWKLNNHVKLYYIALDNCRDIWAQDWDIKYV